MIDLIKKYYQAWETSNIELLNDVIHQKIYGVRTFNEDKFFTNEELLNNFLTNTLNTIKIASYNTLNDTTILELMINQKPVIAKITTKENRIYKVYEILKTDKRRIKCICLYDGSSYSGYQKQLNAESIQGTIEATLKQIFKEDIPIHSSGRTDKGVHALNQVFHFDINSSIKVENIKKVLNSYLPDSIYIKTTEEVDFTFHSRYDVLVKKYQYKINTGEFNPIQRNYEWTINDFDITKFNTQLQSVIGTHDFASFTKKTDQSTVRTIHNAYLEHKDNYVYINIEGNGFLRYMVRNIVGAIIAINKGKLKYSVKELLELKDVTLIKDKAPSCGLYLYNVKY
ncbi:tRNA pseudouridine synthase A [Candidatus Izimaplasma bacterium HR1]|jgi:tRNA pseudouridine38-40 synthase|uniref:tRNA pseudouridine(38-40) synthase TruA n=1 Tax=Candidatus Izimoplasma sp. HR1 TaxID=1541959 RepID=UPI0004F8B620|nr:tRNA pseudouridine synthase A [Candidatus Izimaplasma bacterium HR1]